MLDEILEKDEVKRIIAVIKNISDKEKNAVSINYKLFSYQDKILYIFYDALFKYKIIIEDDFYLLEYLEQIDKLLKKINNMDDLTLGINKLICKFTCKKLDVAGYEDKRSEVLRYVYDKYIINGYFIHGFSSCYGEDIKRNGFNCEEYSNLYEDFRKVNEIFNKYGVFNVVEKDFSKKETFFTDNFVKGCYYSVNSPGYFYNLIYNREYNHLKLKKDMLLKGNLDDALKNMKKIMNFLEFSDEDKDYVLELIRKEWNLLFSKERKIALLLVKRSLFFDNKRINIEKLIEDREMDLSEAIDKILSERNNNAIYSGYINNEDFQIVFLDGFWENEDEEDKKLRKIELANDFGNVYGNVTPLILVGACLISLGVIISIIFLIGG